MTAKTLITETIEAPIEAIARSRPAATASRLRPRRKRRAGASSRARSMLEMLPHPAALFDRASSALLLETNDLFQATFCADAAVLSLADFEKLFAGTPQLGPLLRRSRRNNNHRAQSVEKNQAVQDHQGRWHLISHRLLSGPVVGRTIMLMAVDVTNIVEQSRSGTIEPRQTGSELSRLTYREREIFDLVVAGKLNKIVAHTLDISIKTVEMHRSNIMRKLGARSLADLVRLGIVAGH